MRVKAVIALGLVFLAFQYVSTEQPATAPKAVAGEILVKFSPGSSADARLLAHSQAGGTRVAEIARTGVERVRVSVGDEAAAIARYERNPNVVYAELHRTRSLPEPLSISLQSTVVAGDHYFDEQYGLHNTGQLFQCFPWPFPPPDEFCSYLGTPDADIDAPEAWAISMGSSDVKVAVIDSGVDYTHPDLAASYLGGFDFVNNDSDPMDDHSHGTHVAGIIAAALNNPTGEPPAEEGVVGVAPSVRILAYKVCRPDAPPDEDDCLDFAIQQAIAQAIADGAKVINMSLGDLERSQSLEDAVQDAWNAGLVIVAGAGNNGGTPDETTPFYPAAFANVISVAAFDEDHRPASFTSRGDWVDISAPGNVIMSTVPIWACGGLGTTPGDTGCYNWMSGSSMATPHVSAAAALVWSRSDVTTNSQVVDILLNSANPEGVSNVRLDSWTTHGGLNIHNALSLGVTNEPPVANAGPDQTVTDNEGNGVEDVSLDGSGSSDPDGTIVSYEWNENGVSVGSGPTLNALLGVGTHTLTLRVTDNGGLSGTDTVVITVLPSTDTVTILKASYNRKSRQLAVEATSSVQPNATLTLYDNTNPATPQEIGPLAYLGRKGKYSGTFTRSSTPTSVLVRSSAGGSATSTVSVK